MKDLWRWFAAVAFVAALASFAVPAGPAVAQQMAAPVIAVVEYEYLMSQSEAAKSIAEQLTKIRDGFQSQIDNDEKSLAAEKDSLEKQRSILAPDAFQQKSQEFQKKVNAFQARVQQINKTIDEAHFKATQQLQKTIFDIVSEIAKERGFNIALPSSGMVFAAEDLAITDEVFKRLNQRLPRVDVVLPQQSN